MWLGERSIVLGVDMNTDAVEFFDDVADSKRRQVSHPGLPIPASGA